MLISVRTIFTAAANSCMKNHGHHEAERLLPVFLTVADLTESSVSWNSLPPGSYLVAEPGVRKGRHSYQDLFQSLGAVVISTRRSAHFAELLVIDVKGLNDGGQEV